MPHSREPVTASIPTEWPADVPTDWPAAPSVYSSPNWLRFVDSDGLGHPFYATADGCALVAHDAAADRHPDYRFETLISGHDPAPRLLLGGRRGFCSPIVTAQRPPGQLAPASALATLIGRARDAFPHLQGRWWWPYLPTADVASVVAAARELTEDAVGIHLVGADCVVDTVAPVGPFESGLRQKQRRTNWRREWQRFTDSGLELRQVPFDEIVTSGAPLLEQVESKYGNVYPAGHLQSFLRRQASFLSEQAVVHAIYDGKRMTGYSLAYRWGGELAIRLIGLDYPALRDAAEYPVLLMHAPVRFARQNGISRMHLGMDSFEAKCRRGARPRALWAVVPGTTTCAAAIDQRASQILTQLPAAEAIAFRAEVATFTQPLSTGDHR